MTRLRSAGTVLAATLPATRLAMISARADRKTLFRRASGATFIETRLPATGLYAKTATAIRLVPIPSNG